MKKITIHAAIMMDPTDNVKRIEPFTKGTHCIISFA